MSPARHVVSAPFKWFWLAAGQGTPPNGKEEKKEKKEDEEAPPATELEDLGAAMQSIRDSLKTMGGAFAAAAGVIVTGLGYARLHEAFPLPPYGWYRTAAISALILGALLTLGGAAVFSGRFFTAQRRIPMYSGIPAQPQEERRFLRRLADFFSRFDARPYGRRPELPEQSDEEKHVGLNKSEKVLRGEMFREDAQAEDASSLEALELRANRLDRIARRQPEGPSRAALEKEVARINSALRLTFRRTAAAILERRAQDAYSGWPTKVSIAAFIVGLGLLFGTADWAKGERDLINLRATCAEAEIKGAPDACKPVRANQTAPRYTPLAEATAQRLEAIRTGLLTTCVQRVFDTATEAKAKEEHKNIQGQITTKEVIAAAVALCAEAKSG
jgi:hypothetical protein